MPGVKSFWLEVFRAAPLAPKNRSSPALTGVLPQLAAFDQLSSAPPPVQSGCRPLLLIPSTTQPSPLTELSVPRRQRNWTLCPLRLRLTGITNWVVTQPPEFPLHADDPASGLPEAGSILPLYP